jgi:tetratricopeptide (TPR) repeat protein
MEFEQITQEHTRIAELSRRIGQILVERGDYEQAMHQFRLGLQYLEGIEHKEVARIYNEIGRVHWSQGKLEEAQEWTDRAFDLAERLLDPDELARLLLWAGKRYFQQGDNRRAEEHWLRSLEISQETGDVIMQAHLYQNLGWHSKVVGDYQLALDRLERGKQLAQQSEDVQSLSWISATLGETYYALGQWKQAIAAFQESLRNAEQAGERKTSSRVYSFLGDIYRKQGRWTEADECYQRALAAITATGTPQTLFVVHLSLAMINMERRRYVKAKEHLEKCWEIASRGVGYTSRMAAVQSAMGELALLTGAIDEATAHVARATALAEEAGVRQELAYATMIKGMIAARTQAWENAAQLLGEAKSAFEELGDKYNVGRANAELASMRLQRQQEADRAAAEQHILAARAIFTDLGARSELEKLPVI